MFNNNYINFFIVSKKLDQANFDEIQFLLTMICMQPLKYLKIPKDYKTKMMLLFSYGADLYLLKDKIIHELTNAKKNNTNNYTKMYSNKNPDEVFEDLIKVYEDYKNGINHIDWQKMLAIAEKEITTARLNMGIATEQKLIATNTKNDYSTETNKLQFLIDAFKKPPVFNQLSDNDATITAILQHYYRRPGAQRVISSLYQNSPSDIWKKSHSSSHVIRAYNNTQWYIELLEKCNLASFNDNEKTLLKLAIIYHDAAAEDVAKQDEEKQSATYFKRDIQGKFPEELIEKITLALESKENDRSYKNEPQDMGERVRLYVRVLRFADRMDFIRCASIDENFPCWTEDQQDSSLTFNTQLLDLLKTELSQFSSITEQKTFFQRSLEAAMHGAADLASVAGGYYNDQRSKGDYATRYNLAPNNNRLKLAFEFTAIPKTRIQQIIDNNVRRKIASLAGINTCTDATHKQCKADTNKGIMYGIHSSWLELQQIKVPKCMTLLEKMQCEHGLTVLSQTTLDAINLEITRLQATGIKTSFGTLTQDTLQSSAAQKVLEQQGLEVIKEKRPKGYDKNDQPLFEDVLVAYPHKKTNLASNIVAQI